MFFTLAQIQPFVFGFGPSAAPSMVTICPFSTVTSRLQLSGQSSEQAVSIPMEGAYLGV